MKICIHQPSYFPWLGLLDKIAQTDIYVLLDDVQVNKDALQYRNIFFCNGQQKHITLAVNYRLGITFDELEFKNDSWAQQHLNLFKNYYLKAPFFKEVMADLEAEFAIFQSLTPIEVLQRTIAFCMQKLNIKTQIQKSSEIGYQGKKGEMVLEICKATNANIYLAGKGSYDYMQKILPEFDMEGIEVKWQNFHHPEYKQHPKFEFISGLSTLDLFFFQGYENAKTIFWNNVEKNSTLS